MTVSLDGQCHNSTIATLYMVDNRLHTWTNNWSLFPTRGYILALHFFDIYM